MLVPFMGRCSCDPSPYLIGERNYDILRLLSAKEWVQTLR